MSRFVPSLDLDALNFSKGGGVVTVVTQNAVTGVVIMVAHADREALEHTISTGDMHYRSRTRGLWHKGATSGNVQRVISLTADCDGDAVLARVEPAGPSCHTGTCSCFGATALDADAFSALDRVVDARSETPANVASATPSYTRRLLSDRNLRLKKIGEEAAELIVALADGDSSRATEEAADLFYHMLVGLHAGRVALDDVRSVIASRAARPPE
jgi:phosphoribosyl-ATP pyrophosphohydrolase/phosphoribosyl-AMP cyclohydrolase